MATIDNKAVVALPYYRYVQMDGESFFNAKIYVGISDMDPRTNPQTVYAVEEDGSLTEVTQPIRTNSAGLAVNIVGKIIYPITDQNYSIAIDDDNDNQIYFESNVAGININVEEPFHNLKNFGAVGDGVTDDTDAVKDWASQTGALYAPRGCYLITSPVSFTSNTRVFGESAGVGTGVWFIDGSNTPTNEAEYLLAQQQQAQAGATIFYTDSAFTGDYAFIFEDTVNLNLSSTSIENIKLTGNVYNPPSAGMLSIRGAYDSNKIQNLNAIGCGHGSYCIDATTNPNDGLSQTVSWDNIVAIHAIGTGSQITRETIHLEFVQEGFFSSVKAFGSFFNGGNYGDNDCWLIEDCRGLTFASCSAAITNGDGFRIFNKTRSSVYLTFDGCTVERVDNGWNIDGTGGVGELSRFYITGPRPAFPTNNLVKVKNASAVFCESGVSTAELETGALNCVFRGNAISLLNDNSGNNTNMYFQYPDQIEGRYKVNKDFDVQKDSPSIRYVTADQSKTYRQVYSASSTADNGFLGQNLNTGADFFHLPNGDIQLNPQSTNTAPGVRLEYPSGVYKIFVDDTNPSSPTVAVISI